MAIDVSDIVSAYGSYYLNEGQNMDRLKTQLRRKSVTPSYARPLIVDGELYRMANTKLTAVVQQFQKAWTPKGDLELTPNEIRLRRMKIDLALYPDDVVSSWAGFLADLDEPARAQWPLIRYMLEKDVIPQKEHDMEMNAYWGGEYAAPTPGTAGSAAASMDGLKKLLDTGITGSTMNAVTLSAAPTAATMFDAVEEFSDNISELVRATPTTIFMSELKVRQYLRDKRNTHGTDVNYESGKLTVDFSDRIKIVGLPSMDGSEYIWATPDDNFLYLRRSNGMNTPKVEELKREVFLMTDWYEALGFAYDGLVFVYKPGQEGS